MRPLLAMVLLAAVFVLLISRGRRDVDVVDAEPDASAVSRPHPSPPPATAAEPVREIPSPAPEPVEADPDPPTPRLAWSVFGLPVDPPDPVEDGPCGLFVQLLDDRTGAPVASKIRLWRLDAPATRHWSAGDQLQRVLRVPEEGAAVRDLAVGTYRAEILGARHGSMAPPAFEVRPPERRVALHVALPGEWSAFVVAYDEHGRRIDRARMRKIGHGASRRGTSPGWLNHRLRNGTDGRTMAGGAGGRFGGRSGFRETEVLAGPLGFRLGTFHGDTVDERRTVSFGLRSGARAESRITARGEHGDDGHYVTVLIDPRPVLSRILLPTGEDATRIAQRIDITAESIHRDAVASAPWLHVPIQVRLKPSADADYEPFRFTFTLAEGLPPPIVLAPVDR